MTARTESLLFLSHQDRVNKTTARIYYEFTTPVPLPSPTAVAGVKTRDRERKESGKLPQYLTVNKLKIQQKTQFFLGFHCLKIFLQLAFLVTRYDTL